MQDKEPGPASAVFSWRICGVVLGFSAITLAAIVMAEQSFAQDAADEPGKQTPRTMAVEPATPEQITQTPQGELLLEGKRTYGLYCVGCHGEKGDGQGVAARFLHPKPRDFTSGIFKFSSRLSGAMPTDADLLRTLNNGLHGTSMPNWNLLPEFSKQGLIAYLKTFSPDSWDGADEEPIMLVSQDPWVDADESDLEDAYAQGEAAYHGMATCYQCHAAYISVERIHEIHAEAGLPQATIRDDVARPRWVKDAWGQDIWPPDFRYDKVKTGTDPANLYRVIAAGIGGTAMPTWKDVLDDDDIWAMAYYVRHLADQRNERVTAGASGAAE